MLAQRLKATDELPELVPGLGEANKRLGYLHLYNRFRAHENAPHTLRDLIDNMDQMGEIHVRRWQPKVPMIKDLDGMTAYLAVHDYIHYLYDRQPHAADGVGVFSMKGELLVGRVHCAWLIEEFGFTDHVRAMMACTLIDAFERNRFWKLNNEVRIQDELTFAAHHWDMYWDWAGKFMEWLQLCIKRDRKVSLTSAALLYAEMIPEIPRHLDPNNGFRC